MENLKLKGEKLQNEERTFALHLLKPLKFVLGLPKWEFPGKSISRHAKKSGKMTLPPLKKYSSYASGFKQLRAKRGAD